MTLMPMWREYGVGGPDGDSSRPPLRRRWFMRSDARFTNRSPSSTGGQGSGNSLAITTSAPLISSVRPSGTAKAEEVAVLGVGVQLANAPDKLGAHVEQRQVTNDHTMRWDGKVYQIDRRDVRTGMRKAWVRVEQRLDGTIAVQFQGRYVRVRRCAPPLRELASPKTDGDQTAAPNRQAQRQKRLDEELLCTLRPFSAPGHRGVQCSPLSAGPQPKANGAPGKTGPAIFALYISEDRCSGASPKQICPKNQNPQNGHLMARFDWGFGAVCFGASPVAAVFGSAPGSATSPEHRIHSNPTPSAALSKQDISTLLGIGHFYFALTVEDSRVYGVGGVHRAKRLAGAAGLREYPPSYATQRRPSKDAVRARSADVG